MAADGGRTSATSDANGRATLEGLPDGSDQIYAYASGYQVAIGSVTVGGGVGSATIDLTPGQVATASLTSTPMTYQQILAHGIDPNAPGNQTVIQFAIHLAFPPGYGEPPTLCGFINGAGQFVGDTGSCGGSGGGGAGGGGSGRECFAYYCYLGNVMAVAETIDGAPIIQWLVMDGQATVLKQFFSVDMVINNLSPSTVNLDNGSAALNLPSGLSLAPTAQPQSITQSVASIPGGGSADVNWIVRGDTPGFYNLSADYTGTLDPIGQQITIRAALQTPLHVWGADGLTLTVQADSNGFAPGQPYHVRLAITNTADVPFYNLGLSIRLLTAAALHLATAAGRVLDEHRRARPRSDAVFIALHRRSGLGEWRPARPDRVLRTVRGLAAERVQRDRRRDRADVVQPHLSG